MLDSFEYNSKLYNVAAAINGRILGLVPKKYLPNYGEFYERRQFTPGFDKCVNVEINGMYTYLAPIFCSDVLEWMNLLSGQKSVRIYGTPDPQGTKLALHGATVLVNCSASNETIGKRQYRTELVKNQSARLVSCYVYSSAGDGESTQDIIIRRTAMVYVKMVQYSGSQNFFRTADICRY